MPYFNQKLSAVLLEYSGYDVGAEMEDLVSVMDKMKAGAIPNTQDNIDEIEKRIKKMNDRHIGDEDELQDLADQFADLQGRDSRMPGSRRPEGHRRGGRRLNNLKDLGDDMLGQLVNLT